jgi:putative acetyltransferase
MDEITFENDLILREASNDDVEKIKTLVFDVLREYGLEPDPYDTDSDLNNIEASYFKRGGLFEIIVDKENEVWGCVGIYPVDLHTCELRKMYFAPSIRGKGFGRKLLERTVKQAKYFGFTQIKLETASVLKAAISLYESYGFHPSDSDIHASRSDKAYYLYI